jgi:outer membrane protein TolC
MGDTIVHGRSFYGYVSGFVLAVLILGQITSSAAAQTSAETLQQAWDIALNADHGLKASRDTTAAARSQLAAAKAARLPSLNVDADYLAVSKLPELKADLLGQSFQIPVAQRNGVIASSSATLPIYTGGRIEHGISAASSAVKASEFGETSSEQELKLRVAEAYVNVLRAARVLQVAESHQAALEAHAGDVSNLAQEGMAAKNAQLSSQVAVLDAQQQVLQATNNLDLARAAYNRLLDRPLDQPVVLEDVAPDSQNGELPQLVERALEKRSEIKALDRQVAALRDQAVVVHRGTFPQVGLTGGYDYLQDRYLEHEGQWVLALGLKWNVFDGGSSRNRGRAIDLQASALFEQREDLVSAIKLQVRQSWLDRQTTRKRIDVTESAIAQAKENVRVVRDRYVNGLAPYTEVLDAETARVSTETNNANAVYDGVMAGFRLKYSTGEL